MSKMPDTTESVSSLTVQQEAHETVSGLIERNLELEDIFESLQPLLYTLSVALYGEDESDVSLGKLIEDACAFINNRTGETLQ